LFARWSVVWVRSGWFKSDVPVIWSPLFSSELINYVAPNRLPGSVSRASLRAFSQDPSAMFSRFKMHLWCCLMRCCLMRSAGNGWCIRLYSVLCSTRFAVRLLSRWR
jgi:hypothetical protein